MFQKKWILQNLLRVQLAGLLAFSPVCTVTALADDSGSMAADRNVISEERLQDQVIDYDELGSLIHANNKSVKNLINSSEWSKQEYTELRSRLGSERSSVRDEKEEAEDEGNMESYAEYAAAEKVYSSAIKGYNNMIKRIDGASSQRSRTELEKELTSGAQSLMLSYKAISLQKELLQKESDIYKRQYEDASTRQRAGLSTAQEVTTAYNKWQNAAVSLDALSDDEADVYQSLCLILGVDQTGTMKIGDIPPTDLTKLESIDQSADLENAIINNTSTERQKSADASEAASKKRTLTELEENVKINIKQRYSELLQAKTSREAAETGLNLAELVFKNAQSKYSLGMLSEAQYLQEELNYVQKKSGYQSADLSLMNVLETYNWFVRGVEK